MSLNSLLLICGSACLHVIAHVALKQVQNRTAFVWWMLLWGSALFTPIIWLRWQPLTLPAVGLITLSAIFEAGYFFAIAQAYRGGDLSLVYPLARGTAPLLLSVWSVLLLNEPLTVGGVGGVVVIAAGLYLVKLPRLGVWAEPLWAIVRQPAARWALLAGVCISLYTLVDRFGIRRLDPLVYTCLTLWLTWLMLTPLILSNVGWTVLQDVGRTSWLAGLVTGFTTVAAYAIVQYVIQAGTPVGYAGAAREVSVVFGVAIGVWVLKEPGTLMRLLGVALVTAGVVCIKLFG